MFEVSCTDFDSSVVSPVQSDNIRKFKKIAVRIEKILLNLMENSVI